MKVNSCARIASAILVLSTFYIGIPSFAQSAKDSMNDTVQEQDKGHLTGSFETNSIVYVTDPASESATPDDKFGSNNYLKLDYYKKRFSAGLQLEGYYPAILGHPSELKGTNLTSLYAGWQNGRFSITAGTFYDQFGSGLLFRSWEDRALGINNSIIGARFCYNFKDIIGIKAIWGVPRYGMEYADTKIRGADISLSFGDLFSWNDGSLSIEGSFMDKYEAISDVLAEIGMKPNRDGYSLRLNGGYKGFFVKGEYVNSGQKYYDNPLSESTRDKYILHNGSAALIDLGYNGHGLGVQVNLRKLEWMDSKIYDAKESEINMINYIPALCAQYSYMLTNINPYTPQTGIISGSGRNNSGEIGGQIDIFYYFKRGSAVGGKRGLKIHGNFSTYYTNHSSGWFSAGNILYRNLNIDVEKQFTKRFKSILFYALQEYNPSKGLQNNNLETSHIFILDMTYKWSSSISSRVELQYLLSSEKEDWTAVLAELNFAPKWSIYGSDMFNFGNGVSTTHYYNAGVSFTSGRVRLSLAYGRNRAGFICSGGVCRRMPGYTGLNFTLTTSF